MQANRSFKDRLYDFEELLFEIDPGYKNSGYAYFLTLSTETCEQNLNEIIEKTESLNLGNILEVCEPRECYLEIKPTYSLEIIVRK
jgi:hypothetical protein